MAESGPALTIAICTRNRRDSLLRALANLARQEADTAWGVLVVDNDSEDDTSAAVIALARDFPVTLEVVREPIRGLSHARNRALHAARGRAVVSIDDDVTYRAGWVVAHARGLAEAEVLATGGLIQPVLPEEIAAEWRAFLLQELGGPTGRYDFGAEVQGIPVRFLDARPEVVAVGMLALCIDRDGDPIAPTDKPLDHEEIDRRHLEPACGGSLITQRAEQLQHLALVVREARGRRGLPEPDGLEEALPHAGSSDKARWIVRAAREHGFVRTARKRAGSIWRAQPWSRASWRLLRLAWLGA